jgi:hypothetical protein
MSASRNRLFHSLVRSGSVCNRDIPNAASILAQTPAGNRGCVPVGSFLTSAAPAFHRV